ncbi:alpha/beta hydrolase [Crocosphaera sp. XPORK-15E]|uniref:alpha/beta hydrolase n=1 Tax=Crocosphaera sp. XPORK-15E TaxID=3110247 RepID=UPI002B210892|nr:alpha/beta hydrolase [Crocosphaera sp. XPORK-15E]MEA5536210.1 alpha/beta hydrolase [Crocosphaera sp. XPORK-15E]
MVAFFSSHQRSFPKTVKNLTLGTLAAILTTFPVNAAQRLVFIYGPINLSLGIDSLDTFARTGVVNRELADYMNLAGVNAEQKAEFREALSKRADINAVQLSRFLNTPTGEKILTQMGNLVSIQGGRNGKYALRGAMVQAALDPEEGLTLLNVLNHLAVNMQFNIEDIFQVAGYVELLGQATNEVVEEMRTLSSQIAQTETVPNFSNLPDIRQPGKYGVAPRRVIQLRDESRQQDFYVVLIQPQQWREGKTPVIIISHGLASRPEDFEERARQLASYGYLVALPQHPGSDFQQLESMLNGFSRELFKLNDFVDRPLDISYLIDELERRNDREFGGRLDLKNVGVMGHSFGGYGALAVAGATLDFNRLEEVCGQRIWGPNLSLVLQCRALDLPRKDYNFRDERVTSALVINPVTSVIFGAEGLSQVKIPVILGAGSSDPATPAVIEQLQAFVWINTDDKYFVLVQGQAHVNFSKLDASMKALLDSFPDLTIPKQDIMDQYGNALLVGFAEVYIAKNEAFRPFLTSAYGEYISQEPNTMYLVGSQAELPLSQLFNRLRASRIPPIFPRNIQPNN